MLLAPHRHPVNRISLCEGVPLPVILETGMGARSEGINTFFPRPRHDAQASLCVPIAAHHAPVPSAALPPAHTTKGITSNTILGSENVSSLSLSN
jgi:hypothetical protein